MSNPHSVDPVYIQLDRDLAETKREIDKSRDEVSRLNNLFDKYQAQNGDKREIVFSLFEEKNKLEKLQEKGRFIDDKMKEVIKQDAIKYREAFNKNPWPDPKEVEAFQVQRRLDETKGKEWLAERRIKQLLHPKITSVPAPASHE